MTPRGAFAGLMIAAALAGCSKLPKDIDKDILDDAVGASIGDPATCVLIVKKGTGDVVWRYGRNMTCAQTLPACDAPGSISTDNVAVAAAKGATKAASCPSPAGLASWSAGPLPTSHPDKYGDLVYAASMNSKRGLPGREMATRLEGAFAKAGF
ncbi:hypothetical protein BH11PSE2_BH11PSE2_10450 [soil metagenome]